MVAGIYTVVRASLGSRRGAGAGFHERRQFPATSRACHTDRSRRSSQISEVIQDDADAADNEAAINSVEVVVAEQAPADLAMEGPILPTVAFIPTPVSITVGANVEVTGVGNQELNIRNVPGLTGSKILFRSPEGSLFDIIGGPQEADGFSWWHVRDAQFQLEGWAVANYLQVTS